MSSQSYHDKRQLEYWASMSPRQQEQAFKDIMISANGGITKEKYDALVVENAILKQKMNEVTKHDNFGL